MAVAVLQDRVEPVEEKRKLVEEQRLDERTDKVPYHMGLAAARDVLRAEIAKHCAERTEEVPEALMEDERTDKVPYHILIHKYK